MQNQNESGRSMIEMLGVLSIMGVIMYGAVAGINFGIEMYKINATYNQIEEISRGVLDLYSWSSNFNGLGNNGVAILCANDVISPCGAGNTEAANEWGGRITVAPSNNGQLFTITYTQIPYIACERLKGDVNLTNVCPPKQPSVCGDSNELNFVLKTANGCP